MFSNYNVMKLEINSRKNFGKLINMSKLNKTVLKKPASRGINQKGN